ncbi:MAG: hypothetical protein ACI90V_008856, partial [Bacillariaceae sp.]
MVEYCKKNDKTKYWNAVYVPISAAFVNIPPVTRVKSAIEEAPNPNPANASATNISFC